MKRLISAIPFIIGIHWAQSALANGLLMRSYREGEVLRYVMTGRNRDGNDVHTYQFTSSSVAKKDQAGTFFEEVSWGDFYFNDEAVALDPMSLAFRQQISLDLNFDSTKHLPQQQGIDPRLRPASDDLMNFYVDLQLVAKFPMLRNARDHFYFPYGQPVSYMNGQAQTCIDFDLTLKSLDEAQGAATVEVKHVPPRMACVSLSADWMHIPVAGDRPNNVIQTIPQQDGTFKITLGQEIIDVEIQVDLKTGKILKGTLTDQFELIDRICADKQGAKCEAPTRYNQRRDISLTLQP